MFSCGYKAVLCILRRLGYLDDRINAPIAGFISALSLGIEAKGRKALLLVLVLSRSVDSFINLLEEKGSYLPQKLKFVLIFMAANLLLQGCMAMQ